MQTFKYIATWLTLGPIYNPDHQTGNHYADDGHPKAADIIQEIDKQAIDPKALTVALEKAPAAGETLDYGNGELFPARTYAWRELSFADVDWSNVRDVHDAIHNRLGAGVVSGNPDDPDSFAGKHHALVFLLAYVFSPDARTTHLCLRSDDAVRFWLNGAEILPLRYAGDRDIDEKSPESCAEVKLRQGINILLAAVAETHVEWGFSSRFENDQDLTFLTQKQDSFTVCGTVSDSQGNPVDNLLVRVYDKDIRRGREASSEEIKIGSSTTNDKGYYSIEFLKEHFQLIPGIGRLELKKDAPDLIVKVFNGDDDDPLVVSSILFNADKLVTIDLAIPKDKFRSPSGYEKLKLKVIGFLGDQPITDLREDDERQDITFVARKANISSEMLKQLIKAEKLSATTAIPSEFLFALASHGFPADDLRSLYKHRMPALRRALKAAIEDNTLTEEYESDIEDSIQQIKTLAIKELLNPNPDPEELTIGMVLKSSRLSRTAQEHLVATALEVEGRGNEFWEQLANIEGLTATDLNETRTTLQVAALTGYHLPLYDRVLQKVRDNNDVLLPLKHLATLDEETWLEMVRESGVPEAVEGADEEARVQTYTKALFRQVEIAFPTAAITAQIKKSDWPLREEISTFLSDYPDFDLLADSLDRAADINLDEPVRKEVKRLQRLSRLTPYFKEIKSLADAGIGSGRQIAVMSEGAFMKKYAAAIEDEQSRQQTHQLATQRTATTAHMRARYGREQDYGKFSVIPPALAFEYFEPAEAPELPEKSLDWEKLFGSQDMCHCEHCRSIRGPASYLVDLLEFIKNETIGGLDVLFYENRRPDIAHIKLNCHNTNTPLPYVDLANEIFEQAVANRREDQNQTTWTQEELAANPEHIIPKAYQVLRGTVYPWNLPFDLPAEESRVYLDHLGTSRYELMEVFHTDDPLADIQVATEYLGLSERDKDILNGTGSINEKSLWGLSGSESLTKLDSPRELLKRSGLTLDELDQVLKLGFVNGWAETPYLGITYGKECKLEAASVNLSQFAGAPARLCRFVRLKRTLGWEMGELDAALRTFRQANSIGYIPLLTLSHLERMLEQLKLPLIQLLTLFGDISIVSEITERPSLYETKQPSLYERVFLSKSGVHPDLEKEVREVFAVTNLAVSRENKKIVDYLPHISASLGVSAETITDLQKWLAERAALRERVREPEIPIRQLRPETLINLASLSTHYRLVKLARALQLKVPELLVLLDFLAIGPATLRAAGNPAEVKDVLKPFVTTEILALVKTVEQVKNSCFSISELEYLLRHRFSLQSAAEKSLRERAKILDELRTGLRKIADEYSLPPESDPPAAISDLKGEMLREKFALILPEELVGIVLNWAKLESKPTQEQASRLIDATPVITGEKGLFDFALDSTDVESIVIQFDFDNPEFKVEPEKSKKIQQNLDYVLGILIPRLRETMSRSLIKQQLATALGLDATIAEKLLELWVLADGMKPDDVAIQAFLTTDFITSEKTIARETYPDQLLAATETEDFPAQFRTLLRLQKVALVFSKLNITVSEATYLFAKNSPDWLDPRDLPLDEAIPDQKNAKAEMRRFTGLLGLVDVCQLRDRIGGREPTLIDILNLADEAKDDEALESLHEVIANRLGWNLDDFNKLCDRFAMTSADAFKDERGLLRLEDSFKLAKRIGVRITLPSDQSSTQPNVLAWLADSGLDLVATSIKRATRSRYNSDETWGEVAHPLQNAIREKKRAALVGYLLNHFQMQIPQLETPHPQLKKGSSRPAVRELQKKLNAAGANPQLVEDGIFGSKTRAAVFAFQEENNLVADGIVGNATWAKLDLVRVHPRDTNDLYSHFLIDPEMSACMLTSRIKQSISSVQLFIQRIFLQIESVHFEDIEAAKTQWEWMKNYRVSEANKRVFLTPENWIYPELRTDKTPIFKDFESELQQNELTTENIEKAYLNYVYRLEEVSNLDIRAQCYGLTDSKKLHVFGRTKNTPYIYYYRFRKNAEWSPWKKINIDIEGDHLLPFTWNNKLYLFWPIFTKKSNSPADKDPKPIPHWEIKFTWSRYNDGTWDTPRFIRDTFVPKTKLFNEGSDTGDEVNWPAIEIDELSDFFSPNYAYESPEKIISPYKDTSAHIFMDVIVDGDKLKIGIFCPLLRRLTDELLHTRTGDICISTEKLIGSEIILSSSLELEELSINILERPYWNLVSPGIRYYTAYGMQANLISGYSYRPGYRYWNSEKGERGDGFGGSALWQYDKIHRCTFVPISDSTIPFGGYWMDTWLSISRYLFFSDGYRTFHIEAYNPKVFYHPFIKNITGTIYSKGISGGLFPKSKDEDDFYRQRKAGSFLDDKSPMKEPYEILNIEQKISYPGPSPEIFKPREDFTFEDAEAYSCYNWEIFFHIPLLIVDKLSKNQQFEEALNWFHVIFDPLTPDSTDKWDWQRPWKFGRFFDNGDATRSIEELMVILSKDNPSTTSSGILKQTSEAEIKKSLIEQIERWRLDPFNPHLLARLRITPYMKTVVMKYLDNLIAWTDQLFRRDSIESINEATQLYILAAQILGDPPQELPEREHQDRSYWQIKDELDEFRNVLEDELPESTNSAVFNYAVGSISNALLKPSIVQATTTALLLTNDTFKFPAAGMYQARNSSDIMDIVGKSPEVLEIIDWQKSWIDGLAVMPPAPLQPPSGIFFCISQNDQLLEYWDTLADRLFKIRHCMNIEGIVRQLPLFEPPIDPGLLVKAAAAGIDFSSVLNDLNAPLPHFRFNVIAQKATEICQEVKSLGSALLSVLEKKDAEALGLLRSGQELRLLESIRDVRKLQVKEAEETLTSLERAKENAENRRDSYEARITEGKIGPEIDAINKRNEAKKLEHEASEADKSASDWGWVPNVSVGTSFSLGESPGGADGSPRPASFSQWNLSTTTGGMLGVHYYQSVAASKRAEALEKTREAEIADLNVPA